MIKVCAVDDCENKAKGPLCSKHHWRQKKYGSTDDRPGSRKFPRGYLTQLVKTGYPDRPGECWDWPGARNPYGYGIAAPGLAPSRMAHRVSWELRNGPVPEGRYLDHICHNRACFNPAHLEPVTKSENGQNRTALTARNTSGFRGVTWKADKGKWCAQVTLRGRHYFGGYFDDVQDAAAAAEALRLHLGVRNTKA